MKPSAANLLNAVVLIGMGLWGYFGSASPSKTALIPVVAGVIFLALNNGVKAENKVIAHVAVVLTLLIALSLFMPFKGAMGRGDTMGMVRVGAMILTGLIALGSFIKSFIDARKAREATQ